MKKYWHELEKEEQKKVFSRKNYTIGDFMAEFSQPDWCEYPNALEGQIGCWSLVYPEHEFSEENCKDCDCYKHLKGE